MHVSRYALLFPVYGAAPRLVLLPSREDWDPACGCPAFTDDLDTDMWFEGTQSVTAVESFPGTNCYLFNGYDIITLSGKDRRSVTATPNETLRRLFSIEWSGSLLVVKRASRYRGRAVHITPPEISLISTLVER